MGEAKRNDAAPQFCDACFTGDYAVELTDQENRALTANVTRLHEHKARK
jgi:amidophosphoribosyltransferase